LCETVLELAHAKLSSEFKRRLEARMIDLVCDKGVRALRFVEEEEEEQNENKGEQKAMNALVACLHTNRKLEEAGVEMDEGGGEGVVR